MRSIASARVLLLLLCSSALALTVPTGASAQEDDEFADEFEEEEASPAATGDSAEAGEDELQDEEEAALESVAEVEGFDDAEGSESASPTDPASEDDELRARGFRMHNTLYGPTGGLRVVDAAGGATDTFRTQLAFQWFTASDFLVEGDDNDRIGATLSISWAVADFLELFGSISSYANSNTAEQPELFQVLGDTLIGGKLHHAVLPWMTVGGDLSLLLLNTVGDIGVVAGGTSVGFRGNVTADLRRLEQPLPLVLRFNLQYLLDNSSELIEDVEQRRFDALPDARPMAEENRHLISRVERFALNINRTDRFTFALGVEAPLRAAEDFYVSPLLEWQLAVPVNRQGYDCLFLPKEPGGDEPVDGEDGCLDRQGVSSFPQTLTFGARVLPPVRGFAAFAAFDIGLTGVSTHVREVAATAPWNLLLGFSYAYDTRPPPIPEPVVREVERRVEVQIPPPPKGRVRGTIVEAGAGTAVANAVVAFPGRELTRLQADEQGAFVTYELDPGEVALALTHPEYEDGTCSATIAEAGGDVELRCELTAKPRVGALSGRVLGSGGLPISMARVNVNGPSLHNLTTDSSGRFTQQDLRPGRYTIRVEADGFLITQAEADVVVRQTAQPEITLVERPRQPLVQVRRREITIKRQINFATDSATIESSSFALMQEIADVMLRNPQIRRIEIQGHTDNTGRAERNTQLSQERADSVRSWLIQNGVAADRLEARGYGPTRPLVPNITAANRARNRRVQFIIQDQAESATPTP